MDRFLRYSLEKGRKIRVVLLLHNELKQKTALVVELQPETVTLLMGAKTRVTLPIKDILSCDYARGDHGED